MQDWHYELQPPDQPIDWQAFDNFWLFIAERQRIWHKRFVEQLPPPWTYDPILQENKFTNVYRQLDPGTKYVLEEILEHDAPIDETVFNVVTYRLIGRSEAHKALGWQQPTEFDHREFIRRLRRMRDRGESVFTGAYMVSAYDRMGGDDKIENVANLFRKLAPKMQHIADALEACTESREAYRLLHAIDGLGNFLAFQCLVDLRYPTRVRGGRPTLNLSNDDWARAGPGAVKGLRIIFPQGGGEADQLEQMKYLRQVQRQVFSHLAQDFPYWVDDGVEREIDLSNIQNCLCEYHKYVKIKAGTGKARASYEGHGHPPSQQRLFDYRMDA